MVSLCLTTMCVIVVFFTVYYLLHDKYVTAVFVTKRYSLIVIRWTVHTRVLCMFLQA